MGCCLFCFFFFCVAFGFCSVLLNTVTRALVVTSITKPPAFQYHVYFVPCLAFNSALCSHLLIILCLYWCWYVNHVKGDSIVCNHKI